MRFFLLPISTRRTLLYCQRTQALPTNKEGFIEKGTAKAAKLWADWEKRDSGWQRKVVDYGNHALRRIPYEEWGLRSVPPLSSKRRKEEISEKDRPQLVFPESVIPSSQALGVLRTLGTEREALHRYRLTWCLIGMPIAAPFGILPIIPNLPFYYLIYRGWAHWRALAGGKHIQFLTSNNLLKLAPSPLLDTVYPTFSKSPSMGEKLDSKSEEEETMLLSQGNRMQLVKELNIPELEVELERAIWQVEHAIRKKKEEQSEPKK